MRKKYQTISKLKYMKPRFGLNPKEYTRDDDVK